MILKYKNKEIYIKDCKSFFSRLKGLMFCRNINKALLFRNCNSVHTCFMKKSIDIIMCNKDYEILFYFSNVGPWKVILPKKGVYLTIETPSNYFDIKLHDKMEVI